MYESFTIEQIDALRELGLAITCDGDRGWINSESEEECDA